MSKEPTSYYQHYAKLYGALIKIIQASEQRLLQDNPDELFNENSNFFVKAYLVSLCTYLEAYLQDTACMYANELNSRVKNAKIPHNFVHWRIAKDITKVGLDFKELELTVERTEISDGLSGNPHKTIKLFQYLGVDLQSMTNFNANKGRVNAVVRVRNNIVHHNDKAADTTFSDLLSYIEVFLIYMKAIDEAVIQSMSIEKNNGQNEINSIEQT